MLFLFFSRNQALDTIKEIQHRARAEIEACQDLQRLDELRVGYLGM